MKQNHGPGIKKIVRSRVMRDPINRRKEQRIRGRITGRERAVDPIAPSFQKAAGNRRIEMKGVRRKFKPVPQQEMTGPVKNKNNGRDFQEIFQGLEKVSQ